MPVGSYNITVNIIGLGFASMNCNTKISFLFVANSISPLTSSVAGL